MARNNKTNSGQPQNDQKAHRNNPGSNPPGSGPGAYHGNNRAANGTSDGGNGLGSNDQKAYQNNPGANPPGTGKSD